MAVLGRDEPLRGAKPERRWLPRAYLSLCGNAPALLGAFLRHGHFPEILKPVHASAHRLRARRDRLFLRKTIIY